MRLRGLGFVQRLQADIFQILYSMHNFQVLINDLYLKNCRLLFCLKAISNENESVICCPLIYTFFNRTKPYLNTCRNVR